MRVMGSRTLLLLLLGALALT
nr:B [Macaca fascicularis] [Macaca fascicularis]